MKQKELVLVTGGAGFIGSHLVDALLSKGFRVRVLDNLSPPTHNKTIPKWLNSGAEFIKGDVRKKTDWQKALIGVDYIFHLAAYMDYHLDFSNFITSNTSSTALLYETIIQNKQRVKKIIIASSQSVYGEGNYQCPKHGRFFADPRTELQLKNHQWEVVCPQDKVTATIIPEAETDELRPQIPYAISKAASEQLSLSLGKSHRIPTVVLRYSIVQGPRQSFRHFYSGALRDFSVRALAQLPIVMQEDAQQIRDFVNIHDVIATHLLVMHDKKADYEVFNVGSGTETRVFKLAQMVCEVVGTPFKPEITREFRINSPRHSKMNIEKLKRLNWNPQRSLEESIREYVDWIRNYPEALRFWKNSYKTMHRKNILRQ